MTEKRKRIRRKGKRLTPRRMRLRCGCTIKEEPVKKYWLVEVMKCGSHRFKEQISDKEVQPYL